MKRLWVALRLALALVFAAVAVMTWTAGDSPAQSPDLAGLRDRGAAIFSSACAACHGDDLQGISGRGPSLRRVGAAAVDFYVGTGRMPLARPGIEPQRATPIYGRRDRQALITYITSRYPGGPAIEDVQPSRGDIREGLKLFADNCSGCHQAMGRGGIAPGLVAPPLTSATPTQIGEAIRVGPYLMPRFSPKHLDAKQVDSISTYVTEVLQRPPDRGGWGIGNIGPFPEGLVAFVLAGAAMLIVARLIGERTSS